MMLNIHTLIFISFLLSCNVHSKQNEIASLPVDTNQQENLYQTDLDDSFTVFVADNPKQEVCFYWKDNAGNILRNFQNLKTHVSNKNQKLVFAMNGGMFMEDFSPLGLYIEDQKTIRPINQKNGKGNFYLMPNGVFYITTENKPVVCTTDDFVNKGNVKFATQSGPMLVVDGKIHSAFTKGSHSLYIRNGVGITKDNKVVFVISNIRVNFYDFAQYFISLGCTNALYLDGFVSRIYFPEKDIISNDANFGVIIGVTESKEK